MKNIKIILLLLFILQPFVSGAEKTDDIPVGRIEFISNNRCEVLVLASSDLGLSAGAPGNMLYTVSGRNRIKLTVTGTQGRFICCTFKCGGKEKIIPVEGADVHFAAKDNSASGYPDVKILIHRLVKHYRDFILAVESTDDPEKIAAAVNSLAASIDLIIPEMARLNDKYPELADFMNSPPEELKAEVAILKETGPLLSEAFYRVSAFSSHRPVNEALKRLQSVMKKMESPGK